MALVEAEVDAVEGLVYGEEDAAPGRFFECNFGMMGSFLVMCSLL